MKKNIKVIVIMAFYIGLVLLNTRVYATTGKIINDLVRIRKQPSTSSEIVEVVSTGEKVEIIDKDGEWYKVKYNTLTGYVREDMVNVDKSSETKSTETKKSEEKSSENKVEENKTSESNDTKKETNTTEESKAKEVVSKKVEENETITLNSDVNVRILPLINSSKIGKLTAKTSVFISEKIGSWSYIENDKVSGWVQTSKLEKNDNSTDKKEDEKKEDNKSDDSNKSEKDETNKSETVEEKTMYVSATALNVRKEPKTNAEVIDQLLQNDTVKVIEKVDNTWSKIRISGRVGYVASQYLSTKKVEVTSRESSETRKAKTEENKTKTAEITAKKEENKTETKTEVKTETKKEAKTETKVSETSKTNTQNNTSNTSGKPTGEDVVAYAKQFLGCKYVYATAGPNTFDCSGFTSYVYKHFGYKLNRVANDQQKNGIAVKKSELKAGDILCFTGHVGIYISDGNFIHAENPKTGVRISTMNQKSYIRTYVTARRIIY